MGRFFEKEESELLQEIINLRRDVRGNRFQAEPIKEEELEKIFEAALFAPSVGFSQPWEFVLVDDSQVKDRIFESFYEENQKAQELFEKEKEEKGNLYERLKLEGIKEAPVNLAVFYKPSSKPVLGQTSMEQVGKYSVVCAIQNMWLKARALNIGLGWVSILDEDKVKSILNAPQENELIAYLCLGYVKEFLDRPELEMLKWEKRKQLVIHRNSYE